VRNSQNYESAVHANSNFRAAREQKECGPIDDALAKDAQVPAETAPILTNRTAIGSYRLTANASKILTTCGKHWLSSNATELKLTVLIVAGVALASLIS
jgi:hypothetical protein